MTPPFSLAFLLIGLIACALIAWSDRRTARKDAKRRGRRIG